MASPLRPRSPSDASGASSTHNPPSGTATGQQEGRQAPTESLAGEPSPNERAVGQLALAAVRNKPEKDVLETVPSGAFTATKIQQDVHIDPQVRGTRGSDGSTGAGAVMVLAKDHNDSFKLTPFGLHVSSVQADGTTVSVSADRQSVFATASVPSGDGGSTSATAGPLAGMLYAAVSSRDGHGNSLGGFLVGLRHGTPGLGGSYAHASALGSVALSPSGIADKTEKTSLVASSAAASGDPAERTAQVSTVKSVSGLAQLVVSAGHGGAAAVVRVAADASSTKTYTETVPLKEASRLRKNKSMAGQRFKAFGLGRGKQKLPKLSEPQAFAPGATLTHDVQSNLATSAGVSVGGVQAVFGQIKSHKTKAKVTRPLASPANPTPKNTVKLTEEIVTNTLIAVDVPLLLSGVGSRYTIAEKSVEYAFAGDDDEGPKAVLQRERNKLFGKGHFVGGEKVELPSKFINREDIQPADAKNLLAKLQQGNAAVQRFSASSVRGGMGWRLAVLPLPSAWLGPRAGLSYTRETNVQVGFVQADDELALVAEGLQHRSQYELPGIGRVAMEVELLHTSASKNLPGSDATQDKEGHFLKYKESYSHVQATTLRAVHNHLSRMVPSKVDGAEAPAKTLDLALAMGLEVSVQVQITAPLLRTVAAASPLFADLGPIPSDLPGEADNAKLLAYHKAALAGVDKALSSVDRTKIQQLIAAFDQAGAEVTLEVQSDAFAKAQKEAAKVQVKFGSEVPNTADQQGRADLFAKVVAPAAKVAKKLDQVWELSHQSPLVFVPESAQMERKASMRDAGFGLAQLVTGQEDPTMLGLMSRKAPKATKKLLNTLLAAAALKSPTPAANPGEDPFAKSFAASKQQPE